MTIGSELREKAKTSNDKSARGSFGGWSIVVSVPGFMGGLIKEYWLSAKRIDHVAPTKDDLALLRDVARDAGCPNETASAPPEQAVVGTFMWRWRGDDGAKKIELPDAPFVREAATTQPGRNDPCSCGSGKKFKKCCLGKPANHGPCHGPPDANNRAGDDHCGKQSCGALVCKLCGKVYAHCHAHHLVVQTMMSGHALRVHPEMIPKDKFEALLNDAAQMKALRQKAAEAPELWAHLFEYIEERKRAAN